MNTTADTPDASPGDGVAADAGGNTSLRAAIMEANALGGMSTITLPAGTYGLSIAGTFENAAATGDLDILGELVITGAGAGSTTIDGNSIDRVFDVRSGADLELHDLTITGGTAIGNNSMILEDRGGAVRADFFTSVLVSGCTITGNTAPRTTGGNFGIGGAIESAGALTIVSSTFTNNSASNAGGAISTEGTGSTLDIDDSTFDGNTAPSGGALSNGSMTTIDGSTFSSNGNGVGPTSFGNGGGIENKGAGDLTITNSTLSGNTSQIGGGILNQGTLALQSTTISDNTASSGGGIDSGVSGTVTIENTIVAGNTATTSSPDVDGTIISSGHNLIGDTTGSTGFGATGDVLNMAAMLGPLADNGGSTQTHALLSGSPAIDAANTATAPPTDQRGRPRIGTPDIGAFETSDPFLVNTTNDTIDINPGDGVAEDASGNTSLRAAIMEANALPGDDSIILPAGTFTLTITGTLEDGSATGDLDIVDDLTISGAGAGLSIIDGNSIDRVFHVLQATSSNRVRFDLDNVTVTGGEAIGSSTQLQQDHGAGLLTFLYTDVTLTDVLFTNNRAPRTGSNTIHGLGGAIATSGDLTILDSRFENNLATNSGGAIYVGGSGTTTLIQRTTFADNVSAGGGAIESRGSMTIDDSLFVGNNDGTATSGNGGALNIQSGIVRLTNSTLSGNESTFGGGLLNFATLVVNSSTITNNSAGWGGGIRNSGSVTIENTIVAGNTAATSGPDVDGGVMSSGHNLVGNTSGSGGFGAAGDLLNVNPMLGTLADNGGPTLTHALLAGSPAIDAANTATAPATDQRGYLRPRGPEADIGALEFSTPFVVNTTNDTVDANPGDGVAEDASGNTSLRAAIMEANALLGADTIILPAGTYTLTIAGTLEDGTLTGDLDILDDLIITGAGAGSTTVDGNSLDRVFDVHAPSQVELHGLTVTGGNAVGNAGNTLEDRGGGLRTESFTSVLVSAATFVNNTASRTLAGRGGAIGNRGQLTVIGSRFEDNIATADGGAIFSSGSVSNVDILTSTFTANGAPAGGAVEIDGGSITDSTFTGNHDNGFNGGDGGAIVTGSNAMVVIANTTVSGNTVSGFGGGILVGGPTLLLNSTITGNSATGSTGQGGGIFISQTAAGELTIENTIVAGNSAQFNGPDVDGNVTSNGHNLIGDTTESTGFGATGDLLNMSAMLGPLADNGGPTQTHALLAGSPAIDAANTATAPGTDQRGIPRPQGAGADIGALEYYLSSLTFVVSTLADESDGDFSAGDFSLREAIEQANAFPTADVILFDTALAGGTVTLGGTELLITDDVSINGLGASQLTIDADDLSRIFHVDGVTGGPIEVSIDGLTLTGGLATGSFPLSTGGAVYNDHGTLHLTNLVVTGNAATFSGGGVSSSQGVVTISDSMFTQNSANSLGGAIANTQSDYTLTNVVLDNNSAGSGGAIYNTGSSVDRAVINLTDVSVTNNTATNYAGGIYNSSEVEMTMTDSLVDGNRATSASGSGGGIVTFMNSDVTITGSVISNNSASTGGGIFHSRSRMLLQTSSVTNNSAAMDGGGIGSSGQLGGPLMTILSSTISGNAAGRGGGGVSISQGSVKIINSTISNNSAATVGGGIEILGSNSFGMQILSTTIVGNRADSDGNSSGSGGGIYFYASSPPSYPLLHNTIVAGNVTGALSADTPDDITSANNVPVYSPSSHNLIGNAATAGGLMDGVDGNIVGLSGAGTIPLSTILNPTLADNGGPTMTHALVTGSPALDAGDDAEAVDQNGAALTSDQRQSPFARFVDGNGDMAATVDIGAYELDLSPRTFIVDTLVDESDGDFSPGDLSLREAIELSNASITDDTIEFDASLANGTITLGGTELLITDDVTITGLGASQLTVSGGSASRIFHVDGVSGGPIAVEISGLTLTGGAVTGAFPDDRGGALFNEGADVTLTNSVVTGNTARFGGGLTSTDGTLTVADTTISGNTANLWGGAIANFQSDVFLTGVTLDGNTAIDGGAMYANGSISDRANVTLSATQVTNNTANGFGGAFDFTARVTLTATGSLFSGNQATGASGVGGVLLAQNDSQLTFINSTITDNSADAVAGGLAVVGSTLRLENTTVSNNAAGSEAGGIAFSDPGGMTTMSVLGSTISGNSSGSDGGGLLLEGGVHTIINSTISGNSAAGVGGGLEDRGATIVIRSSTITGNRADSDGNSSSAGGGIFLTNATMNSQTTLHNTIVAGNVSGMAGAELSDDVNTATGALLVAGSSHNLIGDAATSGGLMHGASSNIVGHFGMGTIPIDTILDVMLADNGGPTLTHALVTESPAIDSGETALAVDENGDPLASDQRLFARVVGAAVDIGAIESDELPLPPPAVMATQINGGSLNRSGIGQLTIGFNQPVAVADVQQLSLFNHSTQQTIAVPGMTLDGNGTAALTWNLNGFLLPNGQYTAELPAGAAVNLVAEPLADTLAISFHVLRGDADGSGSVNAADFSEVTTNFSTSGAAYRAGDTSGDGFVNGADFSPITTNFSASLPGLDMDFGNAPETGTSFPTTLAQDGARHVITGNTLQLGTVRDAEADGQPTADAGGDDADGLTFGSLVPGTTVDVSVESSGPGFMNGWIDFNHDGDWDDPGEQVFADIAVAASTNNLQISIPSAALMGTTFARFRLTETAGYSYRGLAPSGEVEDYQLMITGPSAENAVLLLSPTLGRQRPTNSARQSNGPGSRSTSGRLDARLMDAAVFDLNMPSTSNLDEWSIVPRNGRRSRPGR